MVAGVGVVLEIGGVDVDAQSLREPLTLTAKKNKEEEWTRRR